MKAMSQTLIESPFPSTAEVARKLGLSKERVRSIEKMLSRGSAPAKPANHRLRPRPVPASGEPETVPPVSR